MRFPFSGRALEVRAHFPAPAACFDGSDAAWKATRQLRSYPRLGDRWWSEAGTYCVLCVLDENGFKRATGGNESGFVAKVEIRPGGRRQTADGREPTKTSPGGPVPQATTTRATGEARTKLRWGLGMTPGQSCTRPLLFSAVPGAHFRSTNRAHTSPPLAPDRIRPDSMDPPHGWAGQSCGVPSPTQRLAAGDWPRRTRQPRSNFRGTRRSLGRNAQVAEEGVCYRRANSVKIATDW